MGKPPLLNEQPALVGDPTNSVKTNKKTKEFISGGGNLVIPAPNVNKKKLTEQGGITTLTKIGTNFGGGSIHS